MCRKSTEYKAEIYVTQQNNFNSGKDWNDVYVSVIWGLLLFACKSKSPDYFSSNETSLSDTKGEPYFKSLPLLSVS